MRRIKFIDNKLSGQGFTLIEVIVVLAIILIIAVMSILSWQSFSDATALGDTAKMIETKIKLAKSYSLSALDDKNYGLHLETRAVILFPADVAYNPSGSDNQNFDLIDGVEIYDYGAVGSEIVFSRLTGVTANSGVIGIRMINRPTKTKTITINSQGQTGTDSFEASTISAINNARHVHFALGWNIQNATALTLTWTTNLGAPLTTKIITPIALYFNADKSKFDWEDTTLVDSVSQKIRVHSWLEGGNTVLCVMRDQTETDKLKISFTDITTKNIAIYTNNSGVITVTADTDGGVMDIQ